MHQVRLKVDATYKDQLPLDQDPWEKPGYPTRRKKEGQLRTIVQKWPESRALLEDLYRLDDMATRQATSDFRNRASHSIAPRFSRGITRTVTRTVVQATRIEVNGDGSFRDVPISGKTAVSYGIGGIEPLDLDHVYAVNLNQFDIAIRCFDSYIALLISALSIERPN